MRAISFQCARVDALSFDPKFATVVAAFREPYSMIATRLDDLHGLGNREHICSFISCHATMERHEWPKSREATALLNTSHAMPA